MYHKNVKREFKRRNTGLCVPPGYCIKIASLPERSRSLGARRRLAECCWSLCYSVNCVPPPGGGRLCLEYQVMEVGIN